jgi:predicted acetyltransferase
VTIGKLTLERMSRAKHERELLEFAAEFRAEGDDRFAQLLDGPDEYFSLAERFEKDLDLADDRVPMSHFLFFSGGRLVGASRLRRRLIPVLLLDGGHIGYEVRKSERQKGFAAEILRRSLEEAKKIGIERALLTAAIDNIPSLRTIENAGGVFDQETVSPRTGERLRRYWVPT